MIRYLDKVIRPLALTIAKMSGYVKKSKKDKNKDKNNNLMSFCIDEKSY